ncbi:hypothetical protein K488DRAFT_26710, partial [Vararia minispora EC-137]
MLSKSFAVLASFALLSLSQPAFGRMQWAERDGRALFPRRFGQQNPAFLNNLGSACAGQVCGVLAGKGPSTLLAAADQCAQQDLADEIINAAAQFDAATQQKMINLAIQLRTAEKNTPPDFTTNPPTNRNSVFCQRAPKNSQLNGLVQAQDPANNPNVFFDPALGKSVLKGSQANTSPFGQSGSSSSNATATSNTASAAVSSAVTASPTAVTVSVTTASSTAAAATSTAAAGNIGNFGSCSVPQIEFGVGFDNRKETSFQPVDKTSYPHGSAQNIDIITQFMCDQLVNACGADATAKATCAAAKAAADTATAKTGAQADLFNAQFGIVTKFANVAEVDNQGNVVPGTGSSSAASGAASAAAVTAAAATANAVVSSSASAAAATATGSAGIGNFGSCSVPQIEFGVGFDNRKETSFQPVDKTSYPHGSAQNIDIITQFMCDQLVNACGADATAKATCAAAKAAADTGTPKTGAQADLFNAQFGIVTKFANVAEVDNQGNVVAGTGSGSAGASTAGASSVAATAASAATTTTSAAAAATATATNVAVSGGNLQTFTGSLGATAPAVTANGNGTFQVQGNSSFNNKQNALVRSCDVQHNQCANAANASGNKGNLTVNACGQQQTACNAQAT